MELLNKREAAEYLRISVGGVNRRLAAGELVPVKIGGLVFFGARRSINSSRAAKKKGADRLASDSQKSMLVKKRSPAGRDPGRAKHVEGANPQERSMMQWQSHTTVNSSQISKSSRAIGHQPNAKFEWVEYRHRLICPQAST